MAAWENTFLFFIEIDRYIGLADIWVLPIYRYQQKRLLLSASVGVDQMMLYSVKEAHLKWYTCPFFQSSCSAAFSKATIPFSIFFNKFVEIMIYFMLILLYNPVSSVFIKINSIHKNFSIASCGKHWACLLLINLLVFAVMLILMHILWLLSLFCCFNFYCFSTWWTSNSYETCIIIHA